MTVVVTVSFLRSLGPGYDVDHARAMALVALTTASASITVSLSRLRSRAAKTMVAGTLLMSVVLVQTPSVASLLHLKPLHLDDWMLAIGGGVLASLLSVAMAARFHSSPADPDWSISPRV